jgi:hypothetical protein
MVTTTLQGIMPEKAASNGFAHNLAAAAALHAPQQDQTNGGVF